MKKLIVAMLAGIAVSAFAFADEPAAGGAPAGGEAASAPAANSEAPAAPSKMSKKSKKSKGKHHHAKKAAPKADDAPKAE